MQGDPREPIEVNLLTSLEGMTSTNGYVLPDELRCITREVKDISQFAGYPEQLPACVILMLDNDPTSLLGGIVDEMLHGQVILLFEPGFQLPATTANAYRTAIKRALLTDYRRGGAADATFITSSPPAGNWEGTSLLALIVGFSILYEYDPRMPAYTA